MVVFCMVVFQTNSANPPAPELQFWLTLCFHMKNSTYQESSNFEALYIKYKEEALF